MASTNKEPDNEGWSGRPVSTVSVWEALVRSLQSGRSSTRLRRTRRRNGPLPVGARSIYRYLAECLSAWVRNQVICRYVYSTPFCDRHPLLPTFLRIVTLEDLATVPCGTCYAEKRSLSPLTDTHTYMYICIRARHPPSCDILWLSSFARIDITRSATSTLKPLSTLSFSRSLDENLGIGDSPTMAGR